MGTFIGRGLAVVALALLAVACQSDEQKVAEHMRRGNEYFDGGDFGEAIIEYRSVLQIDPNDGAAHYQLSQAYFKDNKLKEGFWELREAVRLDPSNIDAKLELAHLLFFGKEYEEALTHIEAAIAAEPERSNSYIVQAQILEALKRTDEAFASYQKAIDLDPESWDALNQYAMAVERGGEFDRSEPLFLQLTEKFPETRSYFAYARHILRGQDRERDPEVEAAFRKAIEVASQKEKAQAYLALANFLYARQNVDDAVATLEEGIEASDDKLDLIYTLARYQAAEGNEDKAEELIEKAAATAPDDARPLLILSAFRDRQGDLAGALEAARQAVATEPDNVDAKLREAEVMIEIGVKDDQEDQIKDGLAIVDALLESGEAENPAALVIKAKVDLYYRRVDEAIAGLRAAVNERPEWGQAHFVLGTALAMKGDETAARSELARALEVDPSLLQARRVLAQVHAGLHENEYAVEEGRRYLRERPDDKQLRILVAQSLIRLGKGAEAERELALIPESERSAEVNYAYGRINLGKRNYAEARKYLLAAFEELPTNYDVLNSLYLVDVQTGQVDQSVTRIKAAVEAAPNDARLRLLEGDVALNQGRGTDAEASYKKAIELDPQDLTAYEHLARYYAASGHLDGAIDTYEAAAQKRPDAAQIFHMLGVLYELAGQPDKAIESYETAVRLAPNLGEAKNNLAYLLADSGKDLDRALELAQEAKALLPDSSNAADTLGWVLYKRGVPGAAIAYLKEAEAGLAPGSASLGVVRFHLAQAYAGNGDDEEAAAALERSLAEVERQNEDARKRGGTVAEPEWAPEARAMLVRLQSS